MKRSKVRVGNAAYEQKQNDIYGILMDVIYQQFVEFNNTLSNSEELWTLSKSIVTIVKDFGNLEQKIVILHFLNYCVGLL